MITWCPGSLFTNICVTVCSENSMFYCLLWKVWPGSVLDLTLGMRYSVSCDTKILYHETWIIPCGE